MRVEQNENKQKENRYKCERMNRTNHISIVVPEILNYQELSHNRYYTYGERGRFG